MINDLTSVFIFSMVLFFQHSQLTLLYNCTMNSTLTNVTVPADLTYILLNDLHINEKYQFILLSTSPEKRVVLDVVNFTLTGRGRHLFSLRERLRTHKVFIKDKCFYLNYHKFSKKHMFWMCIRIA